MQNSTREMNFPSQPERTRITGLAILYKMAGQRLTQVGVKSHATSSTGHGMAVKRPLAHPPEFGASAAAHTAVPIQIRPSTIVISTSFTLLLTADHRQEGVAGSA